MVIYFEHTIKGMRMLASGLNYFNKMFISLITILHRI